MHPILRILILKITEHLSAFIDEISIIYWIAVDIKDDGGCWTLSTRNHQAQTASVCALDLSHLELWRLELEVHLGSAQLSEQTKVHGEISPGGSARSRLTLPVSLAVFCHCSPAVWPGATPTSARCAVPYIVL